MESIFASGRVSKLFDRDRLTRQIRHASHLPETGICVTCIDTSQCSDDPRSDMSAFAAGLIHLDELHDNRPTLWLTEVEFGRFTPEQLPERIAQFIFRHRAQRNLIERINGSAFLRVLVDQRFEKLGIDPKVMTWTSARNKAAKAQRISRLVRLSREDKLILCAGTWNDAWLDQAEKWTGTSKNRGRFDDLLDASAGLCEGIGGL
jgi:hypothetical protein